MFALRFSFKRKRKVKIIVIKNIAKKKTRYATCSVNSRKFYSVVVRFYFDLIGRGKE